MKSKENNIIVAKSYDFSLKCVNLHKYLCDNYHEYHIGLQLMRSGTSIGANVREAIRGYSKSDFTAKMGIALKEANETGKWLEILLKSDYIDKATYKSIDKTCATIRILLIASIKTVKSNLNK